MGGEGSELGFRVQKRRNFFHDSTGHFLVDNRLKEKVHLPTLCS